MRAIVSIKNSKEKSSAKLISYCLSPKPASAKQLGLSCSDSERVGKIWTIGLTCQLDNIANISRQIEERTQCLSKKGKMYRHVILSVEEHAKSDKTKVNDSLEVASRDFIKRFASGSRALCVRHDDSGKSHVHLIIETFNPATLKRLDWSRSTLKKMQDMKWTDEFTSGRGSRNKNTAKTQRAKAIQQMKKQRSSRDTELANSLVRFVKSTGKKPKSFEDLHSVLQTKIPAGWTLKDKTKRGRPLRQPSVNNGKTTVRLTRLWRWLTQSTKNKSQDKETMNRSEDNKHK